MALRIWNAKKPKKHPTRRQARILFCAARQAYQRQMAARLQWRQTARPYQGSCGYAPAPSAAMSRHACDQDALYPEWLAANTRRAMRFCCVYPAGSAHRSARIKAAAYTAQNPYQGAKILYGAEVTYRQAAPPHAYPESAPEHPRYIAAARLVRQTAPRGQRHL